MPTLTLGRRVRHGGRDVQLSGRVQGRHFGVGQSRQPELRGRLGRALPRTPGQERRERQLRRRGQSDARRESPRQTVAGARRDGRQCPPYNTYLVVDALIKANKDFDLLILPNARHGYGRDSNYMMRRRWDYFVRNLLGAEPPHEYEIGKQNPPVP